MPHPPVYFSLLLHLELLSCFVILEPHNALSCLSRCRVHKNRNIRIFLKALYVYYFHTYLILCFLMPDPEIRLPLFIENPLQGLDLKKANYFCSYHSD